MIRNIDKRLRFLDKIINHSDVIDVDNIPHKKVNFGSQIKVLDLNTDEEKIYIIVGTHETNPNVNKISNKSPLGRVLLGKEVGEEIEFSINNHIHEYEILEVKKYDFKAEI